MVLIDLVMHFGRTAANIAHDICRPDTLIGRDLHLLASTMGCWPEESNVDADHETQEKPSCCLKSLHGKLNEKSVVALVLPIDTDSTAETTENVTDELAFANMFWHEAKRLLNATNGTATSPRGICTLACPIQPESKGVLPVAYPVTKQQNRFFRGKNCAEWCGTDPCELNRKDTEKKPSIWLDPHCFNKLVCKRPLRHDIVHMPGSNKETREYQQTWIECPPLRIIPKTVCCTEPLEMPPICRRPKRMRPLTAANCESMKRNCKPRKLKCPKTAQLPCCDVARDPPSCKIFPTPACCHKRCTPFPSFSECCKPPLNKKAPVECQCLARPTLCEMYADWRKKYGHTPVRPVKFIAIPE